MKLNKCLIVLDTFLDYDSFYVSIDSFISFASYKGFSDILSSRYINSYILYTTQMNNHETQYIYTLCTLRLLLVYRFKNKTLLEKRMELQDEVGITQ